MAKPKLPKSILPKGALPASDKSPNFDVAMSKYLSNERMSAAESELLGLYHPAGGGVKLSRLPSEYTAEFDMHRELKPKKIITPESMLGGASVPFVGDSADAGKHLIVVNGVPLSHDVNLQGGSPFMRDNKNSWASGQSVITSLNNQIERALQGVNKVYAPHVSMSGTGGDFNTMTTKTLLGMFDPLDIPVDSASIFDNRIRTTPVKNQKTGEIKYPFADFVGIHHPELSQQLLSKQEGTGNLRKAFVETMNKAEFQKMGFPEPAAARFATSDRALLDKPIGSTGYDIAEFTPGQRIITDPEIPHDTYPVHLGGENAEYAGSLAETVPAEVYFKDYYEGRRLLGSPKSSDTRAFTMSAPIQYHDQAWLDNIMGFITARDKKIKTGEYAEGGLITDTQTPAVEAIKDTVRDPQAAKMLDLDLARLATMNQPQRMAGGGFAKKMANSAVKSVESSTAFRPTKAGDTVGGYFVRDEIPDRSSIGASLENYNTLGLQEVPMSAFETQGKPQYYSKSTKDYTLNLADQINQSKELNPLIVVKDKEGYYVLEGGHRFDALRELDAQSFPALVVEDLDGMARGGVVKMAEGGTPERTPYDQMIHDQALARFKAYSQTKENPNDVPSLDDQRLELMNSPVIEATPQSTFQKAIGTVGGYMDRAGNFVKETMEPIAESHPIRNYMVDMLLADPLKSAGAALQDYTKTSRDYTEDQPYRGNVFQGSGQTLSLDPRVLDIMQFAQPAASAARKVVGAGAKAVAPFAKNTAEMAAELYARGQVPGMVSPNAYMTDPSVAKPSKVLAPANEQGFYSPTEAAALNLQRKSGQGQAFLNDLMKGDNVRPDEINAMGLDTFLKGKTNVTADEVRDYIAQNKLQLGEARYDNSITENAMGIPEHKPTKFEQWSMPGGDNYREVVLTLPPNNKYKVEPIEGTSRWKIVDENGELYKSYYDQGDANRAAASYNRGAGEYTSSHWDDPNPLAHIRLKDFTDVEGKKTLLVDEVQSDWHQAGREKGYKTEESTVAKKAYRDYAGDLEKRYVEKIREEAPSIYLPSDAADLENFVRRTVNQKSLNDMAKALGEQDKYKSLYYDYNLEIGKNRQGVPDAPYKEDWYQLGLKRAIKEAIDGGYDRVALPTGDRVNERFSLAKHLDKIVARKSDDGWIVEGYKGKTESFNHIANSDAELSAAIGKDLAKKIINDNGGTYEGLDLKIGGEGNRKYYDEVYPNFLKKFGKKYGASVGKTTIDAAGNPEPIHYMDITPAMRKEFSTGIHMKNGGKVQFANDIDAMRHELSKG